MDRPAVTGVPPTFKPVLALEDCFDAVYGLDRLCAVTVVNIAVRDRRRD